MTYEAYRVDSISDYPAGSEGLLPARMNPLPDELLSSWLVRLAMAHGLKLHSFCVDVFGRKISIWNRDIDKLANAQVLRTIADKTGVSFERIFQTTLADYAGKIYEKHNPLGNTVWIMPLRIYHRQHLRNGLQFCPFCLREDAEPYYRREWRLSWVTVCQKHEIILLDKCPGCSSPVVFHRQEMGNRNQPVCYSQVECPYCEIVWTSGKSLSNCKKADNESVKFLKSLKEIVISNWGMIPEFGSVHSILYFSGLKQLLRVLSVCNRSLAFRAECGRRTGINLDIKKMKEMNFDYLPVERRYSVLKGAVWLLERWSNEFIDIATITKTWSSVLLPQNDNVPFWYQSVIEKDLIKTSFGVSEIEILSALSLLEEKHRLKNRFILPLHLKQLMRNKDILRKKSEKFNADIHERIRNFNHHLMMKSLKEP